MYFDIFIFNISDLVTGTDFIGPLLIRTLLNFDHNSVVMTVLRRGILDFSLFTIILSWTNQGEISSRLVLALCEDFVELVLVRDTPFVVVRGDGPFVVHSVPFVAVSLLFTMLALWPFLVPFSTLPTRLVVLGFPRLLASMGSLLWECGFLLTLDKDLVTGWLLANDVSILLTLLL